MCEYINSKLDDQTRSNIFPSYSRSLAAVHEDAYEAFQTSRDLNSVIERCLQRSKKSKSKKQESNSSNVEITLMTPVLPMLVKAFCILFALFKSL